MKYKLGASVVTVLALAVVSCGDATEPLTIDTQWSGVVANGDAIEIKGINGDIIAGPTTGNSVIVTVSKEGDRSDPTLVDIEVITHSGGVTICAMYPDVPGEAPNECGPGDQGTMNLRDNDVQVTFWVSVPAGVTLIANTINGSVDATDLESDVCAVTVNGDVNIATSQLANATTVNGSITSFIGLTDWDRDLHYTTVNGNVFARVPTGTNADVRISTVNGSITVDMQVTIINPGDVRGVLGTGGSLLTLSTVNGDVELDSGS